MLLRGSSSARSHTRQSLLPTFPPSCTHSLPPIHVKPPVGLVLNSTETTASPVVLPQLEAVAMPA